jgi:hypothetical protein
MHISKTCFFVSTSLAARAAHGPPLGPKKPGAHAQSVWLGPGEKVEAPGLGKYEQKRSRSAARIN